jgi:hypothetical protein
MRIIMKKKTKRMIINVALTVVGGLFIVLALAVMLTWTGEWAYNELATDTILPAAYVTGFIALFQLGNVLTPKPKRR